MYKIDRDYVIRIRRELHRIPELAFDLPKTTALVKRELDNLGISYTEEFGPCSIVGFLNPDCTAKTVGIRADMDALPIDEATGLPFASEHAGKMHACGHDAHTAMLLGTAKALKEIENDLPCRVKLLFQPSEEGGSGSGAALMAQNGALDDVDIVLAQHVAGDLEVGTVRTFNLETDAFLERRIEEICAAAVEGTGVTYTNTNILRSPFVYNDVAVSGQVRIAAEAVIGAENIIDLNQQMASEDFAHMQQKCPGVMFRLGTGNREKGINANLHNPSFTVDEDSLEIGAAIFAQFVCNQ